MSHPLTAYLCCIYLVTLRLWALLSSVLHSVSLLFISVMSSEGACGGFCAHRRARFVWFDIRFLHTRVLCWRPEEAQEQNMQSHRREWKTHQIFSTVWLSGGSVHGWHWHQCDGYRYIPVSITSTMLMFHRTPCNFIPFVFFHARNDSMVITDPI